MLTKEESSPHFKNDMSITIANIRDHEAQILVFQQLL
jgi:hypothetical protein